MANNLVIFDLDGTLADTMDDLHTAISGMLVRLGYPTRTKEELLGFINNGAREFVRRSLPSDVQESELIIDTAVGVYDEEYAKCFAEKTHLYEGIYEALSELKEETGCKFAVLSNKQDRFVKEIIKKLFPEKFFAIVQGQVKGVPTKPDPTALLEICRLLRTKTENCTLVGDSDVDIKTAIIKDNIRAFLLFSSWDVSDWVEVFKRVSEKPPSFQLTEKMLTYQKKRRKIQRRKIIRKL